MNAHGIEIAALAKGDVVRTIHGEKRTVVRVVETDGARGGIVDTMAADGRYSRSNGFRLGDEIVAVERMAAPR